MIDNTLDKIRAAASNGLTKQEAAALIGAKLTEEQLIEYNKVKGLMKLKLVKKSKVYLNLKRYTINLLYLILYQSAIQKNSL